MRDESRNICELPHCQKTPSLTRQQNLGGNIDLVAVHGHSLRVPAQLTVRSRADGSAAGTTTMGAALLERQELLGTEGLVVDLRGGLDEILKMSSEEEVSEVDEFAVSLILDVDDTPSVLSTADLLAVDND